MKINSVVLSWLRRFLCLSLETLLGDVKKGIVCKQGQTGCGCKDGSVVRDRIFCFPKCTNQIFSKPNVPWENTTFVPSFPPGFSTLIHTWREVLICNATTNLINQTCVKASKSDDLWRCGSSFSLLFFKKNLCSSPVCTVYVQSFYCTFGC